MRGEMERRIKKGVKRKVGKEEIRGRKRGEERRGEEGREERLGHEKEIKQEERQGCKGRRGEVKRC